MTDEEAAARLGKYGPNRIPHAGPAPFWRVLLQQFRSPLIYVLLAAGLVALVLGDAKDAGFISAVVILNALIGAYQEWRAERGVHALQRLLRVEATVVRSGAVSREEALNLVPGDVVLVESGDRVPADVKLVSSTGLEVDESLLTGESVGVGKDAAWVADGHRPVSDRRNMVFAGTVILHGRARGVVVATGLDTQVGRIASDVIGTPSPQPPLMRRMARFSRAVAVIVLAAALALSAVGVARGERPVDMFFFGVALAVSAIPEGLPVGLTVALAVATKRMVRRHVIVRKLAAVEGLGSCTLIATDKTGTLTCNELTVREVRLPDGTAFRVTGEGFTPEGGIQLNGRAVSPGAHPALERLLRAVALCNEGTLAPAPDGWRWQGDPTDVALLALARKGGITREAELDREPQTGQIPFEPEIRYAATFHRRDTRTHVYVKGAPERVLSMCAPDPSAPRWAREAEDMAESGLRVLAVAEGPAPNPPDSVRSGASSASALPAPNRGPTEPAGLTLLGFTGMIDPPRAGVREAVARAKSAGVDVTMVTGDHPVTALAIARDLGIAAERQEVVTGAQLAGTSDTALRHLVPRSRVFARVTPHHKLRIVQAAQNAGHFVAVTGDGVNDAPALRAANVGVAMGRSGTDVARDASDIVLADDNFASIVSGIEEGRVAYDNVRKVVYLLVANGGAEVVLVLLTLAMGLPLPLLPTQLLWLNLVTGGILAGALAMEPGEGDVLRRPPRPPREHIFNGLMVERTLLGAVVMGGVAFLAFDEMLSRGWTVDEARNGTLLLMVLFENVNIGNARSETRSALLLSPLRNPVLLLGALAALTAHYAAMTVPLMQETLRTRPLPLEAWPVFLAASLSIFVASEAYKLFLRYRTPDIRVRLAP